LEIHRGRGTAQAILRDVAALRRALEAEVERMAAFLQPK